MLSCAFRGILFSGGNPGIPWLACDKALVALWIALLAFIVSTSIRVGMDAWLSSDRGFILFLPAILVRSKARQIKGNGALVTHVRFGDVLETSSDVRFAPVSGHEFMNPNRLRFLAGGRPKALRAGHRSVRPGY